MFNRHLLHAFSDDYIIPLMSTVTGHGEVTVSNIVDAGTYGILLQPQQPTTGIQCTDLRPRRFGFDFPAP